MEDGSSPAVAVVRAGDPLGTSLGRATVVAPDIVRVDGAATYGEATYVHVDKRRVVVASRIEEVLDHLRREGLVPAVDPVTISSQLDHIQWITPTTAYEGIARVLAGQHLTIRIAEPPGTELGGGFPYFDANSRQDQTPSTRHLLELLTEATERTLAAGNGSGLLMLSSGKDSTAVALALAELGRRDVTCLTFGDGPDDPEVGPAADVCHRLGLTHRVVSMPSPPRTEEALRSFFAGAAVPSTDLAQVPYAVVMQEAAAPGAVVLDGTGNDGYMGIVESSTQRRKRRFRVRGRHLATWLTHVSPVDSAANYLLRSRIANMFVGRTMRHVELGAFYDDAVDTHRMLYRLSWENRHLGNDDLHATFTEQFIPSCGPILKLDLAARSAGMVPGLPFCDEELSGYCFNLPEAQRFDRVSRVNKVLLRAMLLEHAGYDATAIGKRPFLFDGAGFLRIHRRHVLDEIATCSLWNERAPEIAGRWLDRLHERPFLHHALLGWYQVSAWHNHSRYLRPATPVGR